MSSAAARPANAPQITITRMYVAADVDAGVARRVGVEADGAHLVAERRAVDQRPEHDRERERDEDPDVEPLQRGAAPEDRQVRAGDDVLDTGVDAIVRVLERAAVLEQ